LRITARGRAVLLALVTTPLVAIILALSLASGGATATGSTGAPLQSVTVLAGQSLWTLAEQVAPQADPREFIADVIALNGLSSAELRPGQSLQIPSAYSHGTSAGALTH
jgi:LysM repeat protein